MKYILIGISVLLVQLCSCKQSIQPKDDWDGADSIVIVINKPIKDSIQVKLNIYKPKPLLNPLLDSIVETLNTCPNPFEGKTDLAIFVYYEGDFLQMHISLGSTRTTGALKSTGVFDYKGWRFNYSGIFIDYLFMDTKEQVKYTYADPTQLIFNPDDRGFRWSYLVDDCKITGLSVYDCNKFWNWDGTYIKQIRKDAQ